MSSPISIAGSALSYECPDGTPLFQELHFSFQKKSYGLVGPNGVGKTTFLKLLGGELRATRGTLKIQGTLAILPQLHRISELRTDRVTIEQVLDVQSSLKAIKEIQDGKVSSQALDAAEGNWDLESRIQGIFHLLGIEYLSLKREVYELSGGELIKVVLAQLLLKSPEIILLDEPTNNLDHSGRQALMNFIENSTQCVIVASHDRQLLAQVHCIAELSHLGLSLFGGDYSFYLSEKQKLNLALEQQIRSAQQQQRRQKADLEQSVQRQQKRMAQGKKRTAQGGMPKIVSSTLKRKAQVTLARTKDVQESRLAQAHRTLCTLRTQVKERNLIQIDVPKTHFPPKKELFALDQFNFRYENSESCLFKDGISFHLAGPKRVKIIGPNGAGKTTLVKVLLASIEENSRSFVSLNQTRISLRMQGKTSGRIQLRTSRVSYLDQSMGMLEAENDSLLEYFSRRTPHLSQSERRIRLGRFLFNQDAVLKKIAVLSGGERMRAALACALFSEIPPELLILDEPTNNLDVDSIEQLESALSCFEGAMLVISHDLKFLENIGALEEIRIPD